MVLFNMSVTFPYKRDPSFASLQSILSKSMGMSVHSEQAVSLGCNMGESLLNFSTG